MVRDLYKTQSENVAYAKGFRVGSLAAEKFQVGAINSKERTAFWDGVEDRARHEIKRLKTPVDIKSVE